MINGLPLQWFMLKLHYDVHISVNNQLSNTEQHKQKNLDSSKHAPSLYLIFQNEEVESRAVKSNIQSTMRYSAEKYHHRIFFKKKTMEASNQQ